TVEGDPVAHEATWSEDGTTLTLTPTSILELSTEYRVEVASGLAGAAGGATRAERVLTFRTVEPPRVVSTSPSDGETGASRWGVNLEFNNPMDGETLKDAISISGVDREDWTLFFYGQSANLNVRLEPSTTYTVTIGDGVRDRSGLPLPPHSFTFTTGALEPGVFFAIPSDYGTFNAAEEQELLLWATNVDSVDLTLHRVTEEQVRRLFRTELKDDIDD